MTASGAYDPRQATGYRMEQLASAFDRVRDARDWKAPFQAVIPAELKPVVEQAVLWFTGTAPVFESHAGEPDRLVVRAPGYGRGPEPRVAADLRSGARSLPRDLRVPSSGRSERAAVSPALGFPAEARRHPLTTPLGVLRRHARPGLAMLVVAAAAMGTGLLMGDLLAVVVGAGSGAYGLHLGVR